MHPDLLNNSLFLQYYKQWQEAPSSIVFVPIAEYFLTYGLIDDAFKICREGLKRHPELVSGRIVMAKIHLRRGNRDEAEDELRAALQVAPGNGAARGLLEEIAASRSGERHRAADSDAGRIGPQEAEAHQAGTSWNTVTMANIYAAQGHFEQARAIYKSILSADPENEAAIKGLKLLSPITNVQ